MIRITLLSTLILSLLTGCSSQKEDLIGSWIPSLNSSEIYVQGMRIAPNGEAYAINTDSIKLSGWKKKSNLLILRGEITQTNQNIPFRDTLYIEYLESDTLVFRYKDAQYLYFKYR